MEEKKSLESSQLRKTLDPAELPYETSSEIPIDIEPLIFQPRALQALERGLMLPGNEHNIYVSGEPNLGRTYLVQEFLRPKAELMATPPDLLYLYNFQDPDCPVLVDLPAGQGNRLKADFSKAISRIRRSIQSSFESDRYLTERNILAKAYQEKKDEYIEAMQEIAESRNFSLEFDEQGSLLLSPVVDGQALSQEEFKRLSPNKRKEIRKDSDQLISDVHVYIKMLNKNDTSYSDDELDLMQSLAKGILDDNLSSIITDYEHCPKLSIYINSIKQEVIEGISYFVPSSQASQSLPQDSTTSLEELFENFQINLFVDNSETNGAPIIYCDHPAYFNLLGSLDRESELGALHTGYDLIRAGDLHKANYGFLIIRIDDLLTSNYSWEGLLRCLRSGLARIEDPIDPESTRTKTIEPEALKLDLKILVIGTDDVYEALLYNDERFSKHFKIKAHLQETTKRTFESTLIYLGYLSKIIHESHLLPFKIDALAGLIDMASRMSEDNTRLSLQFPLLREKMIEASALARLDHNSHVSIDHIQLAENDQEFRSNFYEEDFLSDYDRKIIKVSTQGYAVGRVNGLSVTCFGHHEFGLPHQIACTVGVGHAGIIDLEREAELGGPIHTKAMMIIKSYLTGRFAQNKPIILTGSLCFEQSYVGIEGDSASGAELAALLSALSGVPINLSFAFTGAVNQSGKIMAVGGINQKIEGFFEVCRRHGLSSQQGVIIPKDNIESLMLKDKIIAAVSNHIFHIYSVETIEQAMEILTGFPCGEREIDGLFPPGSLYRLVDERLSKLATLAIDNYSKS